MVGLNKKQIVNLPNNIIGIERTFDQSELVKLYSLASVFINPSVEETFSLVTIEAIACNTPVVVNGTSAIKELVNDKVGIVINSMDSKDYYEAIKKLKVKFNISDYAKVFSNDKMIKENIKIYEE